MQCPECGSQVLVPSERRVRVDRGDGLNMPLAAVECPDCGKMFVAEGAREELERVHSAPTDPPPPANVAAESRAPRFIAWRPRRSR